MATSGTHEPFQIFGVESSEFLFSVFKNPPPGSVVAGLKLAAAGFSGVRGVKEGPVEEGSRGTVGKPGEDT